MAGFSVVELMIVLSVTAILMSVAAPSLGTFVRNNRLQAQTLEMLRTMHFARSEAIKRKTRVVLCRSADPHAASPTCGGASYTWTSGFLVFAAGDTNSVYNAGVDELIRIGRPAIKGVSVRTNGTTNNNLEYNSDGTTNEGGGTALYSICDERGGAHGRQIEVAPVGRPYLTRGAPGAVIDCTSP